MERWQTVRNDWNRVQCQVLHSKWREGVQHIKNGIVVKIALRYFCVESHTHMD